MGIKSKYFNTQRFGSIFGTSRASCWGQQFHNNNKVQYYDSHHASAVYRDVSTVVVKFTNDEYVSF